MKNKQDITVQKTSIKLNNYLTLACPTGYCFIDYDVKKNYGDMYWEEKTKRWVLIGNIYNVPPAYYCRPSKS